MDCVEQVGEPGKMSSRSLVEIQCATSSRLGSQGSTAEVLQPSSARHGCGVFFAEGNLIIFCGGRVGYLEQVWEQAKYCRGKYDQHG